MGYTLYVTFRDLLGLDSNYRYKGKEGYWGGFWEESALCFMANTSEGTIIISSDNSGLIPSEEGGKADATATFAGSERIKSAEGRETSSTGQEDSQN